MRPITEAPIAFETAHIQRLISPYLDHGYKRDTVRIRSIEAHRSGARALIDVSEYHMPGDGEYHFTSIHAMILVSQVGIVLAGHMNGFGEKPGEIYMRDFTIVCRRRILKTESISLEIEMRRAIETSDRIFYDIEYSFEDGAFHGTLRCFFPTRVEVLQ